MTLLSLTHPVAAALIVSLAAILVLLLCIREFDSVGRHLDDDK